VYSLVHIRIRLYPQADIQHFQTNNPSIGIEVQNHPWLDFFLPYDRRHVQTKAMGIV
jgi:hypothetical protein